jgi:hypothetical protein
MGEKLTLRQEQFLDSIPSLSAIMNLQNNRPKVQYFEGISGLKSVYEDICKSQNPEILMFMGVEYMDPIFKNWIDTVFVPLRKKNNIFAKVIAPGTSDMLQYKESDEENYRNIKIYPIEKLSFTNEITIYDDKIACGLF